MEICLHHVYRFQIGQWILLSLISMYRRAQCIKNSGENSLDDKGEFVREDRRSEGRGRRMGVKGNAFRELTLVASPNVSDGFLSFFDLPSFFPPDVSRSSLVHHGFHQLDPTRRVVDPDEREKRSGAELRFVFSVPGIAN